MSRLIEYVMAVRQTPREQFVTANPHLFLVMRCQDADAESGWTFKTESLSLAAATLGRAIAKEGFRVSPELSRHEVFPVLKAANNPWPERISVGRARNNDIVLTDGSVSKLHAHFVRGDDGDLVLSDAGSRNGTSHNGRALSKGEPVPVRAGDTIIFGRMAARLLDAAGLHDLVQENIEEGAGA